MLVFFSKWLSKLKLQRKIEMQERKIKYFSLARVMLCRTTARKSWPQRLGISKVEREKSKHNNSQDVLTRRHTHHNFGGVSQKFREGRDAQRKVIFRN